MEELAWPCVPLLMLSAQKVGSKLPVCFDVVTTSFC